MRSLPSTWIESRLAELCDFNPRHSSDELRDQIVSFVPMPAVDEVSGEITGASSRRLEDVWKGYTHFQDGDVIFAKITPCMENGKAAVARNLENGLACGSTEFHVLRSHGALEPNYLWSYLRQACFRRDAERAMTGAVGQRRVPTDYLKRTTLPLPPVAEQRRIVAKLDSLRARSARARDELGHIPKLIERYKQAILAKAFSGALTKQWRTDNRGGKLPGRLDIPAEIRRRTRRANAETFANREGCEFPDIPPSWKYLSIEAMHEVGWIIDFADGNHGSDYPRKEEFGTGGVVFITAAQIEGGRVDFASAPRLNTDKAEQLTKGWARGDDVLLTHNATVGRVAIVPSGIGNFLLGTSATYYRLNKSALHPAYIRWAMEAPLFQNQLRACMTQTTRNQVPITRQARLELPIAPPQEQLEIVRLLETSFGWLSGVSDEHARTEHLLPKLDQAILAKAFHGALVPQDPNDEPASALLERIKAERGDQPQKRGRSQTV